jgi:hypothetical protein
VLIPLTFLIEIEELAAPDFIKNETKDVSSRYYRPQTPNRNRFYRELNTRTNNSYTTPARRFCHRQYLEENTRTGSKSI